LFGKIQENPKYLVKSSINTSQPSIEIQQNPLTSTALYGNNNGNFWD